jgi:hypothetical protein
MPSLPPGSGLSQRTFSTSKERGCACGGIYDSAEWEEKVFMLKRYRLMITVYKDGKTIPIRQA